MNCDGEYVEPERTASGRYRTMERHTGGEFGELAESHNFRRAHASAGVTIIVRWAALPEFNSTKAATCVEQLTLNIAARSGSEQVISNPPRLLSIALRGPLFQGLSHQSNDDHRDERPSRRNWYHPLAGALAKTLCGRQTNAAPSHRRMPRKRPSGA